MCSVFKVLVKDDFEYCSISEGAGATIYTLINGTFAFPDNEWHDLPFSILDMWCWNLLQNDRSKDAEFELCFMDGPFYIRCQRNGGEVNMRCIRESLQGEIVEAVCVESFANLTRQVYETACQLLNAFEAKQLGKLSGKRRLIKKLKRIRKRLLA